jgi:hypothetical protein
MGAWWRRPCSTGWRRPQADASESGIGASFWRARTCRNHRCCAECLSARRFHSLLPSPSARSGRARATHQRQGCVAGDGRARSRPARGYPARVRRRISAAADDRGRGHGSRGARCARAAGARRSHGCRPHAREGFAVVAKTVWRLLLRFTVHRSALLEVFSNRPEYAGPHVPRGEPEEVFTRDGIGAEKIGEPEGALASVAPPTRRH